MATAKQPNLVKGNKIQCINYQQCPICYGCRAYDSRDPECKVCWDEGIDGSKRNFNVCNKKNHETWKLNKMITKLTVELDDNTSIESR